MAKAPAVNEIMAAEARARGITFIDVGSVADQAGDDPSLVARDQLHPSNEQYARWVALIEPTLRELLSPAE